MEITFWIIELPRLMSPGWGITKHSFNILFEQEKTNLTICLIMPNPGTLPETTIWAKNVIPHRTLSKEIR